MNFKRPQLRDEYSKAHTLLKIILCDIEAFILKFGKEITLTSIHRNDGVHSDYRAADFRDEHLGEFVFTEDERKQILKYINDKYPRNDDKKTIIHHKVAKNVYHFHVQVAGNFAVYKKHKEKKNV